MRMFQALLIVGGIYDLDVLSPSWWAAYAQDIHFCFICDAAEQASTGHCAQRDL